MDTEIYRMAWSLAAHRGMTWKARVMDVGCDHGEFRDFLFTTGWKGYYIGVGPQAHGQADPMTFYRAVNLESRRLPSIDRQLDVAFCLHEIFDGIQDKAHLVREMERIADLVIVLSREEPNGYGFQETGNRNGLFWGAWRRGWMPKPKRKPIVRHFRIGTGLTPLEEIKSE